MSMTSVTRLVVLATAVLVTITAYAPADDQSILPTRLVIVDKYAAGVAKVSYKAVDPTPLAIHHGVGSSNPADLSGTVRICETSNPANVAVYDLPSVRWVVNLFNLGRYRYSAAAPGTGGAKVLKVKDNKKIKFVAKNFGDDDVFSGDDSTKDLVLNFGTPPMGYCNYDYMTGQDIDVEVTINDEATMETHRMCGRFTIDIVKQILGGAGCKVVAKTATPGPCGVCSPI